MPPSDAELKIILRAKDDASAVIARLTKTLGELDKQADRARASAGRIGSGFSQALSGLLGRLSTFARRFNAIFQGLGIGLGIGSFFVLERILGRLIGIIPDLIGRGEQFAQTLDAIQDRTGMAAEQASVLAAAANQLGIDTANLSTGLVRLAQNVIANEDRFSRLGIATRDLQGNLLPMWDLFNNVRRAIADTGASAQSTHAMWSLLGRGGAELADLVGLTDRQFQMLAEDARAAGLVMDQAAVDAAEAWERTRARLDNTITGLGAQILGGVAPFLSQLVDGIANAIRANMDNIVRFVVQVINFIGGVISGFFGLNLPTVVFAESLGNVGNEARDASGGLSDYNDEQRAAQPVTERQTRAIERQVRALDNQMRALDRREARHDAARQRAELLRAITEARRGDEDAYTRAIDRQIAAIDRQLEAMDRRRNAQDAERRRQELVGEIGELERQLEDLKTEGVFTAGMSEAEAELARQRHAADILEAEERLGDARGQLRDHEADEANRQRREELQRDRQRLEEQRRIHQQQIDAARRLTEAIDRLREFDHDQQVNRQRQALEDERRHLQERLANIRRTAEQTTRAFEGIRIDPATTFQLPELKREVTSALTGALEQAAADARIAGREFALDLRDFLFGRDVAEKGQPGSRGRLPVTGLFDKIGQFLDRLSPLIDGIGKLVGSGPEGIIALIAAWKIGGVIFEALKGAFVAAVVGSRVGPGGAVPVGGGSSRLLPLAGLAALPFLVTGDTPTALQTDRRTPEERARQEAGLFPGTILDSIGDFFGDLGKPFEGTRVDPAVTQRLMGQVAASLSPGGFLFREMQDNTSTTRESADNTERTATQVEDGVDIRNPVLERNIERVADKVHQSIAITNPDLPGIEGATRRTADKVEGTVRVDEPNLPGIKDAVARTAAKVEGTVNITEPNLSGIKDAAQRTAAKVEGTVNVSNPDLPGIRGATQRTADKVEGTVRVSEPNLPGIAGDARRTANKLEDSVAVKVPGVVSIDKAPGPALNVGGGVLVSLDKNTSALRKISFVGDKLAVTQKGRPTKPPWDPPPWGPQPNALGSVGITNGITDIGIMGEAGHEAWAILRNPKPISSIGAGGRGPAVIHTHIYLDRREIAEAVTDYQNAHIGRSSSLQPGR